MALLDAIWSFDQLNYLHLNSIWTSLFLSTAIGFANLGFVGSLSQASLKRNGRLTEPTSEVGFTIWRVDVANWEKHGELGQSS